MSEKKALPMVLKFRAERIIGKAIEAAYFVEGSNNVAVCYLRNDPKKPVYVDLNTKKVVDAAALKINVENVEEKNPRELNTVSFEGDLPTPVYKSKIKKAETDEEKKELKKSVVKKVTKKSAK